jgi:hypothetical protein
VSAAVCCALAARQAHVVDLHVYRMGGAAVLHGDRLYQLRFVWLPFTYPPFAAVAFAALAVVPWKVAVTVLTGASAAARSVRPCHGRHQARRVSGARPRLGS